MGSMERLRIEQEGWVPVSEADLAEGAVLNVRNKITKREETLLVKNSPNNEGQFKYHEGGSAADIVRIGYLDSIVQSWEKKT